MSLALVAIAAFGLTVSLKAVDGISSQLLPATAICSKGKTLLLQSRLAHTVLPMTVGNSEALEKAIRDWRGVQQQMDSGAADYVRFAVTPDTQEKLANFRGHIATYRAAVEPVIAKLKAGEFKSTAEVTDAMASANKGFDPAYELLASIEDTLVEEGNTVFAKVSYIVKSSFIALLTLCAVCCVIAVILAWRITASVVRPVREATRFAEEMANGNLSRSPKSEGRDEVAEMVDALARAQRSLADIVGRVRATAESIQIASSEVAAGNSDLSVRTESAASNLQQTAASMEQINDIVCKSTESAKHATVLGDSSAKVAVDGGTVVTQVVAAMTDIDERSKRIVDIISTIDGIAFQTNILALNAAVEAARAGEQGRGFAVVAGEVRSLAQRSASAAKEIKALISSNVDKVAEGSRLVADAGLAMNEIVTSVQRVTVIIKEISAAANEQREGIAQVNSAVVHLDQATQQNAALVEEGAAAAESLKEQARQLAHMVSSFTLEEAS